MNTLTEADIELAALEWLSSIGFGEKWRHGADHDLAYQWGRQENPLLTEMHLVIFLIGWLTVIGLAVGMALLVRAEIKGMGSGLSSETRGMESSLTSETQGG